LNAEYHTLGELRPKGVVFITHTLESAMLVLVCWLFGFVFSASQEKSPYIMQRVFEAAGLGKGNISAVEEKPLQLFFFVEYFKAVFEIVCIFIFHFFLFLQFVCFVSHMF
jgi:hypothetical protein